MSKIRVWQTETLKGEIDVQGSKNAVLPMLAATVLNKGTTVIKCCPRILDVYNTVEILRALGCSVVLEQNYVVVDATEILTDEIPLELAGKMRSSIIFLGALASRLHSARIPYPGGCSIGDRPVDMHLMALSRMNITILEERDVVYASTNEIRGSFIKLKFPSVGATQNILLSAVLANGRTIIENYAKEPEIASLIDFLNGMGANIKVTQRFIIISGVESLHDSQYELSGDRIVAGTYLLMAAATGGSITLNNVNSIHLTSLLKDIVKLGCEIYIGDNHIRLERDKIFPLKSLGFIETKPFPGFPTDLQSQMTVLLSVSEGSSVIKENIFENRFHTAKELVRMGADIKFESSSMIQITGVRKLKGKNVTASDLRDGAALVAAGLLADGITTVENAQLISRGYEDLKRDLQLLGAYVKSGDDVD